MSLRSSLVALIALVPALSFAAPVKKTQKTVTTTTTTTAPAAAPAVAPVARQPEEQNTLFGGTGNSTSNIASSLKGLSLFAAYDFADQVEDNGGKVDTERAFDIGASYEIPQFAPGIAAQGGAEYDFSRALKNVNPAPKISQFLPFAELTAHLTPAFKLMGGINYNFPSVDNAPQGVTLKGNVGYQFGASFAVQQHIAIDGRYRSVQYTASGNGVSSDSKENGFVLGGRYVF